MFVVLLCMVTWRSVPGKTVDPEDKGSKPVPHQGHPKDHDCDYNGYNAPVWEWEWAMLKPLPLPFLFPFPFLFLSPFPSHFRTS
jgi:hypothetical protein